MKGPFQNSIIKWLTPGYSIKFCYLFFVFYLTLTTGVLGQVINRAEYFIDADPGKGNGTAVTVSSPSANVNFNFTVPTTSLSNGFHVLGFRIRQSSTGFWSHAMYNSFYIVPPVVSSLGVNITKGEYFFDVDPGDGNGTSISVTPSPSVSIAINNISTSSLSSTGFHTITFRFRDDKGKWTHGHSQTFYVVPPNVGATATTITKAEYFFDTDSGVGNNTPIPITAGNPKSINPAIPLPSLTPGFHKIGIRYRDNINHWSHAEIRSFYILDPTLFASTDIVAAEFFVDTDPGIGSATAIPNITAGASLDQVVALNMNGVATGAHTLTIRLKDSKGFWSYEKSATFSVSSCIPPSPPVALPVSRCNEGSVTLTATGATGLQQYRWYDDPILNSQVGSGASYTTPLLTTSKKYYVSIFDPSTSCESARTEVNVTVTVIAKPALNVNGSIQFCEGNSILLSAPSSFVFYAWSNGATTQTIVADTTGNYSVSVSNDGACFSPSSDPVNVTVLKGPAKPGIQVTGSTTLCGNGSTTLSGPAGFQYLWSTGATTEDITITQSGIYSLTVRSGGGCSSLPSDPVVITTGSTKAIITQSGNLLIANAADTYKWFLNGSEISGATNQVLEIGVTEFGIYAVEVNDGGCMSRSEDFEYLVTSQEPEPDYSVQVFPNPVQGNLTVHLPKETDALQIIDPLGKILIEKKGETGVNILETNSVATGMYYLVIKSHDHVVVFKIQKL